MCKTMQRNTVAAIRKALESLKDEASKIDFRSLRCKQQYMNKIAITQEQINTLRQDKSVIFKDYDENIVFEKRDFRALTESEVLCPECFNPTTDNAWGVPLEKVETRGDFLKALSAKGKWTRLGDNLPSEAFRLWRKNDEYSHTCFKNIN